MTKVMTAVEWHARLEKSRNDTPADFGSLIIMLVGGAAYFLVGSPGKHLKDPAILYWTLLPALAWIAARYLIRMRRHRMLRSLHPEMEYVKDWQSLVGNIDSYPVPGTDQRQAVVEASTKLKNLVLCANASFAARDGIGDLIIAASKRRDDAYLAYLKGVHQRLEEEAKQQYELCKKAWLLFVQQLSLVEMRCNLEEYRNLLLKTE